MSDDSDYELPPLPDETVKELCQPPAKKVRSKKQPTKRKPNDDNGKLTKIRERNRVKAIQPKEAKKNMQLLIDVRLRNMDRKGQILAALKEKCADVSIISDETLTIENCVCWKRRDFDDETLYNWEPEICIILNSNALLKLLDEEIDSLFLHVNKIKSQLSTGAKLRFVVIGLTSTHKNQKIKNVSVRQIIFETALRCGVTFHEEPDYTGVGQHLADCTKSIAEKLSKKRKETFRDCLAFAPEQKCVKLSKDDRNSNKLCWRQMLLTMIGGKPNSDAAAKTISDFYNTPKDLLTTYARKSSLIERELMLENLIADPLANVRVGPSISTAIYRTLMLSDHEVTVDKPKLKFC